MQAIARQVETKTIDFNSSSAAATTVTAFFLESVSRDIFSLANINMGESFWERQSNKIYLKSFAIRYLPLPVSQSLVGIYEPCVARFCLIQDLQSNQSSLPTDLFAATNDGLATNPNPNLVNNITEATSPFACTLPLNMKYRKRFKIILDRLLSFPGRPDVGSGIDNHPTQFEIYKKLDDLEVEFTGVIPSPITSVQGQTTTGTIYVYMFGSDLLRNSYLGSFSVRLKYSEYRRSKKFIK